jgi:hypothetical protein
MRRNKDWKLTGGEIDVESKDVAERYAGPTEAIGARQPRDKNRPARREVKVATHERCKTPSGLRAAAEERPPPSRPPAESDQDNASAARQSVLERASHQMRWWKAVADLATAPILRESVTRCRSRAPVEGVKTGKLGVVRASKAVHGEGPVE